jgi:Protein of unknown function (DUF3006)
MNVSIDHIDEGIAVLVVQDDFRERIQVPVSLLPHGSREGDVLTMTLRSDPAATAAAKERVAGLIKKIKKRR